MDMPVVDMVALKAKLTAEQFEIASKCIANRKGAARLRASKPTEDGRAAYVWRMSAFLVSPKREHNCMPITADFDIKDEDFAHRTDMYVAKAESDKEKQWVAEWDEKTWERMHRSARRNAFMKEELDPITNAIVDCIDKKDWNGVRAWGRAFFG